MFFLSSFYAVFVIIFVLLQRTIRYSEYKFE